MMCQISEVNLIKTLKKTNIECEIMVFLQGPCKLKIIKWTQFLKPENTQSDEERWRFMVPDQKTSIILNKGFNNSKKDVAVMVKCTFHLWQGCHSLSQKIFHEWPETSLSNLKLPWVSMSFFLSLKSSRKA